MLQSSALARGCVAAPLCGAWWWWAQARLETPEVAPRMAG
jgi:hypothetical protein